MISPTLFSIYINSLLVELGDVTVSRHAYADDLGFICYDQSKLEKAIEIVKSWCTRMKMALNKLKSGIMVVRVDGRTRPIKRKEFSCIPVVNSYCYLGLQVQDNGRYSNHVDDKHRDFRDLTKRLRSTFRDLPDIAVKW